MYRVPGFLVPDTFQVSKGPDVLLADGYWFLSTVRMLVDY
jgi:hypothetical protein